MRVICTICSKHKNDDGKLLPARLRYISSHIKTTEKKAEELNLPFFILSGRYGLIPADEMIPNYDYYLEKNKIDSLSKQIAIQLQTNGITAIDLYTKMKPDWAPYESALRKGVERGGASLTLHQI